VRDVVPLALILAFSKTLYLYSREVSENALGQGQYIPLRSGGRKRAGEGGAPEEDKGLGCGKKKKWDVVLVQLLNQHTRRAISVRLCKRSIGAFWKSDTRFFTGSSVGAGPGPDKTLGFTACRLRGMSRFGGGKIGEA